MPRFALTISMMASVSSRRVTCAGRTPAGFSSSWNIGEVRFVDGVSDEALGGKVGGFQPGAGRQRVLRADDGHQLIVEKRTSDNGRLPRARRHDGHVQAARKQRLDGAPRGFNVDAHFHARPGGVELLQARRQPVIAGVALGADAQHSFVLEAGWSELRLHVADVAENGPGGREELLAGAREAHAAWNAAEEVHLEARFQPG